MSPMNQALNGIFEFYNLLIDFVFNEMLLFDGVTFGWIIIACLVFGFLIRSILVLPRNLKFDIRTDDRGVDHE